MSSRTSYTQFSIMVEFMEKHGDLCKLQALPNGRISHILKWQELTNLLNSVGTGEPRCEEKWRKVWSDFKNNTKKKWAKIQRSLQRKDGGAALKLCLTDVENRVMKLRGVQTATDMPADELAFGVAKESTVPVPVDLKIGVPINFAAEIPILIADEILNTPGASIDNGPVPPEQHGLLINPIRTNTPPVSTSPPIAASPPISTSPPIPVSPPISTSPPTSSPKSPAPTAHYSRSTPQLPPRQRRRKRKYNSVEQFLIACEVNARDDARERERLHLELERERIRQRDVELHLQAQWLEFMKAALNVLDNHLKKK